MSLMHKPDPKPRQLKNLLIEPRFQFKLLSYFIVLFFITSVCLYSTTFLFFNRIRDKAVKVGIPDGHAFFDFLNNQKDDLDILFVGLVIFNFILLIGVGFIVSHRVAGPIYKLKNQLQSLTPDSDDYKLRENDFFQELEPLVKKLKDKSRV